MFKSDDFETTTLTIDGKEYQMEYELKTTINENSVASFGNIYPNDDEEPIEFTFFTINGKIGGYTPMNGKQEFISSIVEAVVGKKLSFE